MRAFVPAPAFKASSLVRSRRPTLCLPGARSMSNKITKNYWAKSSGVEKTDGFRVFFHTNLGDIKDPISPWHDISLLHIPLDGSDPAKNVVNMVVEVPKGETAKYEVSKKEDKNPIRQDLKDGQLRFLKHGPMPVNYGMLPQTWSDPKVFPIDEVNFPGDNDPVDVIDISDIKASIGDVVPVKILGTLCLIDQGEADWKIVGINVNDPRASELHDALDVEMKLPAPLVEAREWFRVYKVADGKPENTYAFGGKLMDKCGQSVATEVIMNCTHSWIKLHTFQPPELGFTFTEHNKDLHF